MQRFTSKVADADADDVRHGPTPVLAAAGTVVSLIPARVAHAFLRLRREETKV
ncbi:hypothetical protein [Streptomyces sp. MP131-18]|uniref:hypothetical protein n=1 Tax=Streptomyces sp. MP131-18 TaxID=1857892 RepID=UPI0015C54362|nr:hypothetical protein [Streptomyces sp. MP131-18]